MGARRINDKLATHGVMPVERVASITQAGSVIARHIEQRKKEHLSNMFEYYERRLGFLQSVSTSRVEWARAKVRATIESDVSLEEFVMYKLKLTPKQMERPRYHPAIPAVEMAALVHAAQDEPSGVAVTIDYTKATFITLERSVSRLD